MSEWNRTLKCEVIIMDNLIEKLKIKTTEIEIPEKTKQQWEKLLNLLVEKAAAQDAVLTKYNKPFLKIVKVVDHGENNFREGDKIKAVGHYCQAVLKNKSILEIENADKNKIWENTSEYQIGLKSYLGYPIFWPNQELYGTICIHDQQERKFGAEIKNQLQFSKDLIENSLEIFYQNKSKLKLSQYYSDLINILPVGVMIEDRNGKILKVNKAMEKITGYKREELLGNTVFDTVVPQAQKKVAQKNIKKILEGEVLIHELQSASHNGKQRYARLQERKIVLPNNEYGIISIQSDITEKIKSEEKIKYASYHDSLTDLYNRSYLEKIIHSLNQKEKLPLALIMIDLNGLKLVNDTYGHNQGDRLLKKMAFTLNKSCRDSDIISRWGGDEFVILLPNTGQYAVKKIVKRIKNKISNQFLEFEDGNKLPLSAAVGYEVKSFYYQDIFEILASAETKMYKNKLTESRSIKSDIVNTLLKTLSEKSHETVDHSARMAALAIKLAQKINLDESEIKRLNLIAMLHDIGKTVIPKNILNKQEQLTAAEWEEIKTHPAVGHRILNATEEFSHVSEEVLSHHEKWDGTGYPRELKGEEIPLLARIIAIADAYEVMTHQQIYQEVLTKAEALNEIEKNAGTQFDPHLAKIFINLFKKK